jgi:hypothetical protein
MAAMVRLSRQAHQRRIMIAMTIYVIVLLLVWPLARSESALWLKALYALAPVPPILYVIWLMARWVLASDELEQRTHLIGLGVAAATVSVFGIITGFLAVAHVFTLDWAATALIWIFPLLMVVYSDGRAYAARRYGSGACDEGTPVAVRFLYVAGLLTVAAAYIYWHKGDAESAGFAAGMAAGMLGGALFFALRQRLRRADE